MYHDFNREDYVTYTEVGIMSLFEEGDEELLEVVASDILDSYETLIEDYNKGEVLRRQFRCCGQELKDLYFLIMEMMAEVE